MKRFDKTNYDETINNEIVNSVLKEYKNTHESIWNQLLSLCKEKSSALNEST